MSDLYAPEQAAKKALKTILADRYADGHDDGPYTGVAVYRGPPPANSTANRHVWIGGHRVDDTPAALAGENGPSNNSVLVIDVFVDVVSELDDPEPVDDEALALAHDVRLAIRDAIKSKVVLEHPALYWLTVTGSQSDGPQPLDGRGWSATVAVSVRFTSRIR